MKKQLFTIVMMIALVIGVGSAMGQSTNTAPYEGANYTYTVNSLNTVAANGDDVYFYVTLATANDPLATGAAIVKSASANVGVWYTSDAESYTDNVLASRSINITWGPASGGNQYRLWVVVQDGTSSCYNYRYIPIAPVENSFDIGIYAMGIGDNTNTGGFADPATATSASGCISLVNRYETDFDASSEPTSDGKSYIYFRVKLVGPTSTAYSWKFTPVFTDMADATWEYSTDLTSWGAYVIGAKTVPQADADQIVYLRAKTPLRPTDRPISASVTLQQLGTFSPTLVPDLAVGNNSTSFTVNPIPSIGTFSGN